MNVSRYKFNDERVTKVDAKRALEDQYGGQGKVICDLVLLIGLDLSQDIRFVEFILVSLLD